MQRELLWIRESPMGCAFLELSTTEYIPRLREEISHPQRRTPERTLRGIAFHFHPEFSISLFRGDQQF